jgi:hypothetical protein
MGKVEKFLAVPVKVILGGEEESIMPFTLEDLPMINKISNNDSNIRAEGLEEAIFKIMKQVDSTTTIEQVKKFSMKSVEELSDVIGKVNELDVDKAKQALIDKLKTKSVGN